MEYLKLNRSTFSLIGICAIEENASSWKKTRNTCIYLLLVIMTILNLTAISLYTIKYMSVDYDGAIYGLLEVSAVMCSLYTLITLRCHSKKLQTILLMLEDIYTKNSNAKHFQNKSFSARVSKIVSIFCLKMYAPGFAIMSISTSSMDILHCYFQEGVIDVKCLGAPYKYALPWDESKLIGWFLTALYSMLFAGVFFVLNAFFLCGFVTICLQFNSLRSHFEDILSELNHLDKESADYSIKIKSILCDATQFNIFIRELHSLLQEAYNGTLFVQMLGGVIFMSTSVFQTDMALRHPNFYSVTIVNVVGTSAANLYMYCFAGAVVTINCLMYGDALFDANWRKMPIQFQKYFIIMIAEAQRPIYLEGYGMVRLSLEAFTKMLRVVFSYYLMFRTLTGK